MANGRFGLAGLRRRVLQAMCPTSVRGIRTMATWLPIAVRSVLHQCSVKWMDFGSKTLDEPFFDYTLQTLFDLQPPPDQRITPLRDLIAAASGVPRTEPAGLVLHISRCGSTVVVRALQAMSNVLVMSEVSPLLSLFSPPPLVDGRAPYSSQEREQAIRAVVTLFAAHSRASAVVIKAHATSLLHIDYIRALWPGVPVLILIRDPVEVVV